MVGTGVRGIQATVPGTQAAISGIATATSGGTTGRVWAKLRPGRKRDVWTRQRDHGRLRGDRAIRRHLGLFVRRVLARAPAPAAAESSEVRLLRRAQVQGVGGFASSTSTGAVGVNGFELAKTGQVYGVSGGTASTTNFSAGVTGYESAATGQVYGSVGGTNSTRNRRLRRERQREC